MGKKFTILVDMDDTLVDTVRTWVRWLNFKHNLNVQYEDLKVWEMQAAFPSLTVDQIYYPLRQKCFWMEVAPKPFAVEYLKKLIDDGHNIYICSASSPNTIGDKVRECLLKHFDYLRYDQLIFMHNKQLINADFCIDDGIHNLIDAPYKGILVHTPYNYSIDESKYGLKRVHNWKSIYEYIKECSCESC